MTYDVLADRLHLLGLTRVERDDRLLDVFPAEQRDKGSELWERLGSQQVYVLRISEPYNIQLLELFAVPRVEIEQALAEYKERKLDDYPLLTTSPRGSEEWLARAQDFFKFTV